MVCCCKALKACLLNNKSKRLVVVCHLGALCTLLSLLLLTLTFSYLIDASVLQRVRALYHFIDSFVVDARHRKMQKYVFPRSFLFSHNKLIILSLYLRNGNKSSSMTASILILLLDGYLNGFFFNRKSESDVNQFTKIASMKVLRKYDLFFLKKSSSKYLNFIYFSVSIVPDEY